MKRLRLLCILLLLTACGKASYPTVTQVPAATALALVTVSPILEANPTATPESSKVTLVVFAAGSLIIPFDHIEKAFEARYPYIDVQAEYHGSIQVMRHATELHELIDVVATADTSLIPMLMYATEDSETGKPYANWYIRFASNYLALAYNLQSKYAGEINAENWAEVLARPDLKVGLADPRFDASGYRALMAFALAQDAYGKYNLFTGMFNERFTSPISIFIEDNLTTVTVPEIIETRSDSSIVIRGASIQLIALLESGDLDFAFEYESVIRQHNLQMLHLPEAVNLGAEDIDYSKVQVNLDFRRFATVKPEFRGERIGYGITIPSNAPHPKEAELFIAFLLGPEGRALMEADNHPLFESAFGDGYANIPPELQALCTPALSGSK